MQIQPQANIFIHAFRGGCVYLAVKLLRMATQDANKQERQLKKSEENSKLMLSFWIFRQFKWVRG